MSTPESPDEDFDLRLDEMLREIIAVGGPEPAVEAGGEADRDDARASGLPVDLRAALSVVPLGVAWLSGSYIVSSLSPHSPQIAHRLIAIALIAWDISLACELSVAHSRRLSYPRLGMWDWCTRLNLAPLTRHGLATFGTAGLVILTLFILFYVSSALLAAAAQIWITLLALTAGIHLTATVIRHSWGDKP
jgi:hypothetical protein